MIQVSIRTIRLHSKTQRGEYQRTIEIVFDVAKESMVEQLSPIFGELKHITSDIESGLIEEVHVKSIGEVYELRIHNRDNHGPVTFSPCRSKSLVLSGRNDGEDDRWVNARLSFVADFDPNKAFSLAGYIAHPELQIEIVRSQMTLPVVDAMDSSKGPNLMDPIPPMRRRRTLESRETVV